MISPLVRAVQEVEAKRQLDQVATDKRFLELKADNDNIRQQLKAANDTHLRDADAIEELRKLMGMLGKGRPAQQATSR